MRASTYERQVTLGLMQMQMCLAQKTRLIGGVVSRGKRKMNKTENKDPCAFCYLMDYLLRNFRACTSRD